LLLLFLNPTPNSSRRSFSALLHLSIHSYIHSISNELRLHAARSSDLTNFASSHAWAREELLPWLRRTDVVGSSLAASRPLCCFLDRFSLIVTTSISNSPFTWIHNCIASYYAPARGWWISVWLTLAGLLADCSHERTPTTEAIFHFHASPYSSHLVHSVETLLPATCFARALEPAAICSKQRSTTLRPGRRTFHSPIISV
jgi:hypothetical protein